ncbi:Uncharacterised protein [Enterobacter roggenkampii]|uniref:Uncharacterized protein n=1 Tax=Enterobacter roggenkampii TaxID=1812935 RepID=A0ABY0J803_9ENTR|nr:Uncharacterised protein [Enterobacter roggenkampii]
MNSLNRLRPAKQFRCLPLVGKDSPFGYVERLNDQACANNYQPENAMVEAFAQMNEKGREEWLKLTGDSETTEVSPSTSSDGSHRLDALYTFAKGTIMSASALLTNSSVNLQS